jgi:hypothetical protein
VHQRLIVNTFLKDFLKKKVYGHRRNFPNIIEVDGGGGVFDHGYYEL